MYLIDLTRVFLNKNICLNLLKTEIVEARWILYIVNATYQEIFLYENVRL